MFSEFLDNTNRKTMELHLFAMKAFKTFQNARTDHPITAITRSPDLSPPPFLFLLAQLAAAACAFIAAFFFRRFRDCVRDRMVMSILVHSNKRQIGGSDVARGRGNVIFHPALDTDLHLSLESAIHLGLQDQQIPQ